VQDPEAVLRHFRDMLRPGGTAYVSTPNLLTLAPPGAEKSDNPWHLKEYRADEFRALCESVFGEVELLGLFHARVLKAHELALRAVTGDLTDIHAATIASTKAQVTVELVAAIRNKGVDAFNEIMRMQA